MDLNSLTPTVVLDTLKCSVCLNYLSCFPVRITSKSLNICGRCKAPEDDRILRNEAFEWLAQLLKFPCQYKDQGCEELLLPKDAPKHEEDCPFRIILCPLRKIKECRWQGQRSDILGHCKSRHSDLFLTNNVATVELGLTEERVGLLEHQDVLLFFSRKFGNRRNVLQFVVYSSEFQLQPKKYSCQMIAKCGNKKLSFDFESASFEDGASNELNIESVLTNDSLTVEIIIGEPVNDPKTTLDLEMLSVLKCCLCENFAIPPIFHCQEKNYCSDCCASKHQNQCASCSKAPRKNISLDNIARLLNYPCKNSKNGCLYIAKPDNMLKHNLVCPLADMQCPLYEFEQCEWRGIYKDLAEHFENNHETVLNCSQLSKKLLPERMKSDIIKFSNFFFRLVCLKSPDEKVLWTVQLVGPFVSGFKYEIEILDGQNKGRRMLVRHECETITKKEDLFKTGRNFCYFFKDQIQEFMVDQCVTFRVRIFV